MATKFVDLETASKELGIPVEKLTEMREKNELRGFRDGATWKFKLEDVERLKTSMDAGGSELDLDDPLAKPDIPDSILLSEVELGGMGPVGSSTVIGQSASNDLSDEEFRVTVEALDSSDIQLASDSLILGDSDAEPSSDVLGSETAGSVADAGSEIQLTGSDSPNLELDLSDSGTTSKQDSNIALGESEVALRDSDTASSSSSSDDSEINITDEEDGVLVLGGAGSDVIGASDSGISLNDPADSGISLEASDVGLGGSVISSDDSLLLGEEDFLSANDAGAEGNSPSQLQQDDDFLLTPLEDALTDDSESSSQVIALDDPDSGFNPSSATVMEPGGDVDLAILGADEGDAATLIQSDPESIIVQQQPALPELPYSGWNLLSLFLCITLLALSGMLIYDLVRQVWSWEGIHPVNSGLMDAIIGMFR